MLDCKLLMMSSFICLQFGFNSLGGHTKFAMTDDVLLTCV